MDYLRANTEAWQAQRDRQLILGRRQWAADEPSWGIFGIPEEVAGLLPDGLEDADTVELGCGTAYVSAWLARRGARPVGVDPTAGQLSIARQLQQDFGLYFPLVRAAAEQVPLAGESFDMVISEYGAAIWADPYRWIPEAARLLRPSGELLFLGNSTLMMLCVPDEEDLPAADRLLRPQFGMHRFEWPGDPTVEFHLSHGDWIRLLRANGLEVTELLELRPPVPSTSDYPFATFDWADRWPCEEVWRARKKWPVLPRRPEARARRSLRGSRVRSGPVTDHEPPPSAAESDVGRRGVEQLSRIFLRPIGSPLPIGFLALGAGSTVLSGLQLGWLAVGDARQAALVFLVFVAPLQFVASMFGFLARDSVGGTGMSLLGGTWLVTGTLTLTGSPGSTSRTLGLLLLFAAAALIVPAAAASLGKVLAAAVMVSAGVRFALTAIYEFTGGRAWEQVSGWWGIALCVLALYSALAFEIEDTERRTVLPVGRRRLGKKVMQGGLGTELYRVEREAGVREQL